MGDQPLVTVIVPVYNVEKYLMRCLDSVVNQTYRNLEIILVNDGSTDGSGEICRQYERRDSRIRLFAQENGGLSAARNTGLDHMRGEYIVFVDSDDYISLSFVEILLGQVMKYHVQMAVCGRTIIREEDAGQGEVYSGRKTECSLLSRDDVYDVMDKPKGDPFIVVWGRLYASGLFKTLRFDVGKIHEDEFIFHKIFDQVNTVCYIGAPLYHHVRSHNSITRKRGVRHLHADAMDAFLSRLEYFQSYGKKKYIKMTERQIIGMAIKLCEQFEMGDEQTKEALAKVKRRIEQVTGSAVFSLRYTLYHISPVSYRFARAVNQRIKSAAAKARRQ